MKKIICIIMCSLFLCGCNNWKNKIQVSSLKLDDNYIIGKLKNITDKAYDMKIIFKLKSGTLETEKICYETIKPEEILDIECLVSGIDESYKYEIVNIELDEKEIPILKSGLIDIDTFEYYFDEIYDSHSLNFISFSVDFNDESFPYIDEVKYENNELKISGKIECDLNNVYYNEIYNTNTNELKSISFHELSSNNPEFRDKLLTRISMMNSLINISNNSIDINRTLLRKDIDGDYCIKIGNLCISTFYGDVINSYNIYVR